jgi:chorismate dehydratase
MTSVRLGAVGYLNARPLVYGLDRSPRFHLRYDLPSECARLLCAREIDLGLVPSIEFLRDPSYRIVPDLAITSMGAVASVALFTRKPIADVTSIAMDTSSRTSVALVRVLCDRWFRIAPAIESHQPDLDAMLQRADAALIIGDIALLTDRRSGGDVQKIDLGEAWTAMTGLPFVWAAWVGRAGAVQCTDVDALRAARDEGVSQPDAIAEEYFRGSPELRGVGARYLRDNIKYYLGSPERAGLELFYRYAAEIDAAPGANRPLQFF